MKLSTCCRLAVCLLLLTFLAGCGSSSENDTAPATVQVFNYHSAAFSNNSSNRSTVYLSGYNAFGQLGNGSFDESEQFVPVQGLGLARVDGFAIGGAHTVAFQNNSSVRAWGSNQYGQLGGNTDTGSGEASKTPVKVLLENGAGLGNVTSVAAGSYHSLAVSGGEVYAWGNNSYGQLGNNTVDDDQARAIRVQTTEGTPLSGVVQVAAGGLFSLALDQDGNVWSWGRNEYGELGDATTLESYRDQAFKLPPFSGKVTAIAAAGSYAFAVVEDANSVKTVWGWGLNNWGQLGASTTGTTDSFTVTPVQVKKGDGTALTNVSKVAAGRNHVLALVDEDPARTDDNTVWGWGMNYYGQLGNNNRTGRSIPDPENKNSVLYLSATPVQVVTSTTAGSGSGTPLAGVTEIFAFGHSSFARTAAGLYAWGANLYGQLGFSPSDEVDFQENPVLVPAF